LVKVLFLKDEKKRKKGEIHQVRLGYFRNYLGPNSIAIVADKSVEKRVEKERLEEERKFERKLKKMRDTIERLRNEVFKFKRKAKKDGELFGSVSKEDIERELSKFFDTKIPEKVLKKFEPLKSIGAHTVKLVFGEEEVDLNVEIEEEK